MKELYFSVDIETDGPIPGFHSILSIGAVAFTENREILGTFSANLECLEGATPDSDTMKWWAGFPDAWELCRKNTQPPKQIMNDFVTWVSNTCDLIDSTKKIKPVFVAYPAGFDFLFVYWYIIKFLGPKRSPFSFSALDIKSFAMAVMNSGYREVSKKSMKAFAPKDLPHTHIALDDAMEQAHLFLNLLEENKKIHNLLKPPS